VNLLVEAADRGVGVLLLSEDLDEILSLSDRIAVIYEGRDPGRASIATTPTPTELGLLMGGDRSHLDWERAHDPPRTSCRHSPGGSKRCRARGVGGGRTCWSGRCCCWSPATTRSTPTARSSTGASPPDGAFTATLTAASPLLFTGLAAAVAFRMGVFNIGGEGQLIDGCHRRLRASASPLGDRPPSPSPSWRWWWPAPRAARCGPASPAVLRAWFNTNEIITTLMLNYLAINLATYLIFGSKSTLAEARRQRVDVPAGQGAPRCPPFWPSIDFGNFTVSFGFILGTAIAVGCSCVFRNTRFGFQVQGHRRRAPRRPLRRHAHQADHLRPHGACPGAVAGIGGASDVGDTRHVLDPKALGQAGYGYAGIVVAALARLNPLAVVVTCRCSWAGSTTPAGPCRAPDFPAGLVGTLQGLLLVCVLTGETLRPLPASAGCAEPMPAMRRWRHDRGGRERDRAARPGGRRHRWPMPPAPGGGVNSEPVRRSSPSRACSTAPRWLLAALGEMLAERSPAS
jgi:ABC-type uncharacterized transport system permease subunit